MQQQKKRENETATVNESPPENENYRVLVSMRFIVLTVLLCAFVAFAVGRAARIALLTNSKNMLIQLRDDLEKQNEQKGRYEAGQTIKSLPDPKMKDNLLPPRTEYTSKTFDTTKSSWLSRWIVTDANESTCAGGPEDKCTAATSEFIDEDDGENHEVHLPAGQHLLMDIENVDGDFLNSEERLAHAMLELVNKCGLTLLSYHCHKMIPSGVSCAGVLLESHVSFHTWPSEGVITLDLYTCGPNSLLPIVPLAKELFAVPNEITNYEAENKPKQPNSVWAYKTRGFVDDDDIDNKNAVIAELSDMEYFPVGKMTDYKNEIVSAQTQFQEVKVFDVLIPNVQNLESYNKSLHDVDSYEFLHPELFAPDRIVFLDGVLQSRKFGESAYHESLVHPILFAHENPRRVAIIGGGEGASLREVLKHKTVEKVVMIEIDEMMVNLSREYLPSWSDCSMLSGSTASCFDDPRVEVIFQDAFQWFIDNFPLNDSPRIAPFDIIIMDALDPQVRKEFVNALYDSGPFLKSIPFALEERGMFISQVGESASSDDPPEKLTDDLNRLRLINSLKMIGFSSIRTYIDNMQSGFSDPWQFVVAFKSFDSKVEWLANPALVNLKIRKRAIPTVDGESPLNFFDGPTMQTFRYPSKQIEVVYCRDNPDAKFCKEGHGFDQNKINLPLSSTLEVKQSSIGEDAGRGVFAKIDIPANSYIGLESLIPPVSGDAHSYDLMMKSYDITQGYWGWTVYTYIHGYGEIHSDTGKNSFTVDSGVLCFINHSCDGKNNVGHDLTLTQTTADPDEVSKEILDIYESIESVYNPVVDRQVQFRSYTSAVPRRAILKGEELFDNYLGMCGKSAEYWEYCVGDLRRQCKGEEVGIISEYETYYMSE